VDAFLDLFQRNEVRAAVVAVGSILVAFVAELVIRLTLGALARKTASDLDDRVAASLRRPVFLSVIFIGLGWSADLLEMPARFLSITHSVLETFAVLIWSAAAFSIGTAVLETLSGRAKESSIVQPRTQPVFEILIRLLVIGAAVYFTFLAWDIDVTAWIASAGIIGIAVGFAAKDTLANFFAGIFIIADAPYKVGDWIVLDGDLRGRVIKIGVRSTRLLTSDDIEITVPNSVIGSSKIVNEVGGPSIKQRIRVKVQCAYGADIDQVRAVLIGCADAEPEVSREPAPQVNLQSFGDSGLNFELRVWIEDPARRDAIIDRLNCRVYKSFAAQRIEIPFPRRDIYIKEQARPH
jgi:small-conductance mechanosensitive channel